MGPPVNRWWNWAAAAGLALAAYFLWELLGLTHAISAGSPVPTTHFDHHPESLGALYRESDHAQYLLLAASLIALSCYVFPRRHRGTAWIYVALMVTLATVALALATYLPCAPNGNEVVPTVGWVIGIFEGDIELAGPGSRCALAFSPGFELARGLAVLLVAWALTFALRLVARQSLDRWRARASRDVDVVVGLDDSTLSLIQALTHERDDRERENSWFVRRPGFMVPDRPPKPADISTFEYGNWWLTGLRRGDLRRRFKGRTTVVVIDPIGAGFHQAELRGKGVRVVAGDATSPGVLEPFLLNWRILGGNRLALRRLYAVTPDQQVNLRVFEAAAQVLASRMEPHLHNVVPRLFVRLDDEREARQWRLEHLWSGSEGYLADALTVDGVAAAALADVIIPPDQLDAEPERAVQRVVLIGEGGLGLALMDELAWRQWCDFELGRLGLGPPVRQHLREVLLLGPGARAREREWRNHRAPWSLPSWVHEDLEGPELFDIPVPSLGYEDWDRREHEWEDLAAAALGDPDVPTVVLFLEAGAKYRGAAARLASAFPATDARPTVMLCGETPTPWERQITATGLRRFARTLTATDGAGNDLVPADSMERFARQQHAVFLARRRAGHSSGEADVRKDGRQLTAVAWDELPEFFREDNIRQHWQVMNAFASMGREHGAGPDWRWRRISARALQEGLAQQDFPSAVEGVARHESRRWNELRRDTGWWPAKPTNRWDQLRMTEHLIDWSQKSPDRLAGEQDAIISILNRFWAAGLTPVHAGERASRGGSSSGAAPN